MDALPCLRCGETGTCRVSLDDGDTITCSGCDAEFGPADERAA